MNNIILLGAPASGKGTQAKKISQYFNIPIVSTGDLIRKLISEKSSYANKYKKII